MGRAQSLQQHGESAGGHEPTPEHPARMLRMVILHNHGASSMHKFVEKRYLSAPWKQMYADLTYDVPSQHEIDGIMLEAKQKVLSGEYLHAPKALPPPRGRPVTNSGERNQSWYEQGAAKPKKRVYTCSLCKLQGHTRRKCDLRQMFED